MSAYVTIKEIRWTEKEKTPFGEYDFNVLKKFCSNGKDIIEYTFKNGVMTYSAMYPANTPCAQKRMDDSAK
jgi:hypothetical protein